MSFFELARQRWVEKQNLRFRISDLRVPQDMPDNAFEPLMVIGDYPDIEDETAERILSGPTGQRFDEWLEKTKFVRGTFPLWNAIPYHVTSEKHLFELKSSQPSSYHGRRLHAHLDGDIRALKQAIIDYRPEAVITLGPLALWAILDHDMPITRLTDRQPDHACTVMHNGQFAKFTLFPAHHPRAMRTTDASLVAFRAARRFLRPASFG